MRVWLLQTSETLPLTSDTRRLRTALLAEQLVNRGHHVLWWASAFNHLRKRWVFEQDTQLELAPQFEIRALKGIGYRKNVSLKRFLDHRIIAKKFKAEAEKCVVPDCIVTSMPSHDLAYEAVCYAKRHSVPVLVDIRDQWPDNFLDHVPRVLRSVGQALLANEFRMLKSLLGSADGLVSMSDVLLDWGLAYAKRPMGRTDAIFHLGYGRVTVPEQYQSTHIQQLKSQINDSFVVTFIGTFGHYHNPSLLVDVARELKDTNVKFVLAGDGELLGSVKAKATGLPNVIFPGWLEQHDITLLLQMSHVGACPTSQGSGDRAFFPNKAFSYLSEGLPVISAFCGELQRVLEAHSAGYTYREVGDLVTFIRRLSSDSVYYTRLSGNARALFDEQYEAAQIYSRYAKHIENVASEYFGTLQQRKFG